MDGIAQHFAETRPLVDVHGDADENKPVGLIAHFLIASRPGENPLDRSTYSRVGGACEAGMARPGGVVVAMHRMVDLLGIR
ncbi:MAG TPA: hypothetical protein VM429_05640, partial [Micropruina sp.]|nr:hypothetical protein [Micropruina sp.]